MTAGIAVERVHARFRSRARINIGTSDDPIRRNKYVAVEEILLCGGDLDVRFPLNFPRFRIERPEKAITRADVDGVTRDRGRVRESPAGFKGPQDLWRRRLPLDSFSVCERNQRAE